MKTTYADVRFDEQTPKNGRSDSDLMQKDGKRHREKLGGTSRDANPPAPKNSPSLQRHMRRNTAGQKIEIPGANLRFVLVCHHRINVNSRIIGGSRAVRRDATIEKPESIDRCYLEA